MSTALDTETAAAGELIALIWGYGSVLVVTDLGFTTPASAGTDIQNAVAQNPYLALNGAVAAYAGKSGAIYIAAQCTVTQQGDGLSYGQILQNLESIGVGPLGSTAALVAGDYSDTTESAFSLAGAIAQQDPGATSAQIQSFLSSVAQGLAPLGQGIASASSSILSGAVVLGLLAIGGLLAFAKAKHS